MSRLFSYLLFAFAIVVLAACGGAETNNGEDYGNILDTPGGLVLNEEEHQVGWGRADCTMCHNLENIHLVNRTGLDINIEQIHNDAITNGIAGCVECHGSNGVQ